MWPAGVLLKDPSKIVLKDCQQILQLWRTRQSEGGAKNTFRFRFYPDSHGVKPAIYNEVSPLTVSGPPNAPGGISSPMVQQSPFSHIPRDSQAATTAFEEAVLSSLTVPLPHLLPVPVVEQGQTIIQPDGMFDILQPLIAIPTPAITPPSRIPPALLPVDGGSLPHSGNPAVMSLQTAELPIAFRNRPASLLITSNPLERIPTRESDIESDPTTRMRNGVQQPGLTCSEDAVESDPSTNEDGDRRYSMHAWLQIALRAQSPARPAEGTCDDLPPHLGRKKTRVGRTKKKVQTSKKKSTENEDNSPADEDGSLTERHQLLRSQVTQKGIRAQSPPVTPNNNMATRDTNQRMRRTQRQSPPSEPSSPTEPFAQTEVVPAGATTSVDQPQREKLTETTLREKPCPRPIKQRTAGSGQKDWDGQNEEDQRTEEDALFTVNRRSGRPPKPKYNIAPPAQLRLEKEHEKRLR